MILSSRGLTLLEILIAVAIFACGIIPIFLLLTESRRVTTFSLQEMQATSLAASMIDALKAVPVSGLETILEQELRDDGFPSGLKPADLGVPAAPPSLARFTKVRVVNQPSLPLERFTNPWGRVFEIAVTVFPVPASPGGITPGPNEKPVLRLTGYRMPQAEP